MTARPETWSRPAEPAETALAALLAIAVFLASWTLLHFGFYRNEPISDLRIYEKYGDWMQDGRVPYRDFRPEYPPLALPAFVLPALAGGDDQYETVFEGAMAACGVLALVLMAVVLRRLGASGVRSAAALAFAAGAPLALGPVVLSRFDLWPALLTVAALALLVAGRDRLAAVMLALSVAAKLYPAVLVPLALAWVWRRRGRRAAAVCSAVFAAVLAACFLPFAVIAPDGVAASLGRQLSRPLQIESLGAAVLIAPGRLLGLDVEMDSSHGSQNVEGALGIAVGVGAAVVQAAALAWLWLRFARGRMEPERIVRYAAAAVVAFVALGKVLSPQYLIWLLPVVPLVGGRRGLAASALLGAALVLTQLWFPYRYWDYARTFDETVAWLVLARDLVLVALLAVLVPPLGASPRGARQARRTDGSSGRAAPTATKP